MLFISIVDKNQSKFSKEKDILVFEFPNYKLQVKMNKLTINMQTVLHITRHASCVIHDTLYLFGGSWDSTPKKHNNLYTIDLS